MFVYLVTNLINAKKYVGQHSGKDLFKYWNCCVSHALNGKHGRNRLLYRAIRKYGEHNFVIVPLIIVQSKQEMDKYETELIARWDLQNPAKGYNLAAGGQGTFGYKFSAASLQRLSEAHKGLKQSEQTKLKRANSIRGIKRSEETKRKMSEAQRGNKNCLGRRMSDEQREKLRLVNLGNHHALGVVRSDEYRQKMSQIQRGKKRSEAARMNMRLAQQRRRLTEKESQ